MSCRRYRRRRRYRIFLKSLPSLPTAERMMMMREKRLAVFRALDEKSGTQRALMMMMSVTAEAAAGEPGERMEKAMMRRR